MGVKWSVEIKAQKIVQSCDGNVKKISHEEFQTQYSRWCVGELSS